MGRFKNGPFRLAIEKQVPIVPVTILNNWILLPDNYWRRIGRPGMASVIIHDPVETKGMTEADVDDLKTRVYKIITRPLAEKYPAYYADK
jgi:1-acyl-sn-glycerol-3-phosphate acyltransferase